MFTDTENTIIELYSVKIVHQLYKPTKMHSLYFSLSLLPHYSPLLLGKRASENDSTEGSAQSPGVQTEVVDMHSYFLIVEKTYFPG